MLLFMLRGNRPEPPDAFRPTAAAKGGYAVELLAAGLFLSAWCALRLLSPHGERFYVDSALALACLALGLWVVLRSLRSLELSVGRGHPRQRSARVAKRAQRRRHRLRRVVRVRRP